MDDIITKIQNLRAKAASAASTESEVQSALDHAAKLMRKHRLTEAQIKGTRPDGMAPRSWSTGTKILPEVRYAAPGIAAFTESRSWVHEDRDGRQCLQFIGMDQDVEMALYLTDLIHNAISADWQKFSKTPTVKNCKQSVRNKMRRDFSRAMAARIRARLMDMVATRLTAESRTTGTELVVLKRSVVTAAQAALGLDFKTVKARKRMVYTAATEAGKAAGDKANLTTGIAA